MPLTPQKKIAIFYGAAHMNDLEHRIRTELEYRPGTVRWLPAVTVQPAKAGLTDGEISTIRGLIKWQMDQLQESFRK